MRRVPWWGLVSATAAPLLLVGGWSVAAAIQPAPFDSGVRTISDLAARDTPHRWLMTGALVGVGISHLLTALALRPAATAGRMVQGIGGLATVMVAASPLPAGGGSSSAHTAAAAAAFFSLAIWPAFACPRKRVAARSVPATPPMLRPTVCAAATGALLLTLSWFFAEQAMGGARVGLSERVAAGAQGVWPLLVVLSVWRVSATRPHGSRVPGMS